MLDPNKKNDGAKKNLNIIAEFRELFMSVN